MSPDALAGRPPVSELPDELHPQHLWRRAAQLVLAVVGVDRADQADALREDGADVVVSDLTELPDAT